MGRGRIAFVANGSEVAEAARVELAARYGDVPPEEAGVVVALGGDGFMLQTLHATQHLPAPVYGMNCGTIGFLMNEYGASGLEERLGAAVEEVVNPLAMRAETVEGEIQEALAINEVSLLRAGPQAAKLRITVDGRLRLEELVCDGALVCTPAGDRRPTTTPRTGRSCPSARTCWRSRRWRRSGRDAGGGRSCRRRRWFASTSCSRPSGP